VEVKEPSAKYLARPRYKQTEVGVVPEDWGTAVLGEIADCLDNLRIPLNQSQRARRRGGIPYCGANGVLDYIDDFVVDDDIILMAEDGGYFDEYATRPIAYRMRGKCWVNNHAHILKAKSGTDQGFLYYSLVHKNILPFLASGTRAKLNRSELNKIEVALPPTKGEQEGIANALSDADALIESLEQLLAKKRQIKQGAMQELLTGKKRLPGFGEEWEVKALGELFTFSGGLSASRDQLSTEGYCYLHYGDIHLSSKSFIDVRAEFQDIPKLKVPLNKVAAKSLLVDGDVVFVDASEDDEGASKHVVVVNPGNKPFISGLHTIVAKPKGNELEYQYRRYCFQTRMIRSQFRFFAVGTKVSGISKTNIAKVTMPVPSVSEQAAIASILSDMDAEIAGLEMKLAKARQLKQGMMQELLTGRIRLV
jgi:type I restriction enzyme S subunit